MVIVALAILLSFVVAALVWAWIAAKGARESAVVAVRKLRDAAQAKQAERAQAVAQAATERRQEIEGLTDASEDRQILADMLNGEE